MASTMELPKEVWLEIVSYLDYSNLKKVQRVSKAFKSYTELPTCQKTMFRSNAVVPKGGTINLDIVVLHPAFEGMAYECDTELDQVHLWEKDIEWVSLTDSCAAEEHATDPLVAFIRVQIIGWEPLQLTNETGVTVVQVMKSLCRFFSIRRHRESRGNHTGWTGWNETKLDSGGNLWLHAMWFDS